MDNGAFNRFVSVWEKLERTPFKKEWRNGTGYYDGAVKEKLTKPMAFQDEAPNSRGGIILPIGEHVVVLFERYTPEVGAVKVIVSNTTAGDMGGAIEEQTIITLFGLANLTSRAY